MSFYNLLPLKKEKLKKGINTHTRARTHTRSILADSLLIQLIKERQLY